MTDTRELVDELRLIGCHANGDARCTCGIGQDAAAAIAALSERCRVLEEALSGLEWACDQLASTRTHEVYLAMIDSGQADALLSLDARRQAARAALTSGGRG